MHGRNFLTKVLILILIAGAGVFALYRRGVVENTYAEVETIGHEVSSFDELSRRFKKLAEDKGAEYAFEILRRAPLPPQTDLHLLGHAVGDTLYKQQGVAGIALCTPEFRNACSHTIAVGAMTEFGPDKALAMIHDACKKAPGGPGAYTMCYHGLGHGVFAYYNFTFPKTVEYCKRTGTPEYFNREYIECVGGSIMELMGGGGHDKVAWEKSRKLYLSASRPLAPCMDSVIPVEARSICLMYLTPRLFELAGLDLGNPDPAHFGKAMNYCEAIPKSEISLRKDCYGGFGKEFVPLVTARDIRSINKIDEKSFATLAEWCGSGKTTEAISACVSSELDSLFWGGENDPRISIRFCASLPSGVSRDACYSELATTISTYTNGDAQKTLCVSVPADKQAQCLASHPPRSQS